VFVIPIQVCTICLKAHYLLENHQEQIAAVILEPVIQGAGGLYFYHPEYLNQCRILCDDYEVVLIFDEIATGFGRAGELFASDFCDVEPDIVCLGKALTGGYMSLAATLTTDRIATGIASKDPGVLMHGPTFMGNPLSCAAANASLAILSQGQWRQQVVAIESQLRAELHEAENLPHVLETRALGSIGVIEMDHVVSANQAHALCHQLGVWLRPFGKCIYTMPPYIINSQQLKLKMLKQQGGLRKSRPLLVRAFHAQDCSSETSLINFSSNDYLGLSGDQDLLDQFFSNIDLSQQSNWMSASSARPLTGTSLHHEELENAIAQDFGKEKALLFNSGYHANSGILPALTNKNDLILADKLVHASIIDGLRLAEADFKRFAHNDIKHLEQLLNRYNDQYERVWLVTESVFSMDGDVAPLQELIDLKKQFSTYLYVDEAHAIGCYGQHGLGLAEHLDVIADIDVLVGVFGKALAGVGAFAVANQVIVDNLINFSRSWLFSTALPPINVQWNTFVWNKLASFSKQRQQLQNLTTIFREQLQQAGIKCLGESYIVPIMRTGNEAAVETSRYLEKQGFLAMPNGKFA